MYKMIINSIDGLRRRIGIKDITGKREQSFFYNYFLIPFYSGISGFATFLFLVIIIDFLVFGTGIFNTTIGLFEVMIASLGFILRFVYELFRRKNT